MASQIISSLNIDEFKASIVEKIEEINLANHELKEYKLEHVEIPVSIVSDILHKCEKDLSVDGIEYKTVYIEKLSHSRIKIVIEDLIYKFRFSGTVILNPVGIIAEEDYNPHGRVPSDYMLGDYTIKFYKAYAICSFKVIDMTEAEYNNTHKKGYV